MDKTTIKLGKSFYKDVYYNYDRYRKSNRNHRDDEPAIIYYTDSKKINIHREEYWINGQIHRDDGPAIIEYDYNGNIVSQSYYRHGEFLMPKEWLHGKLNKILRLHDMYIKKDKIHSVLNDEVIVIFKEEELEQTIKELLC